MLRKVIVTAILSLVLALVMSVPYAPANASTASKSATQPGVSAVLAAVHSAARPAHPAWIMVHRGDTLSGLAQRWCGHANEFPVLAWANHIHNPDLIFVGQKIRIVCHHVRFTARFRAQQARAPTSRFVSGGTLSYSGLERLWISAGGAVWAAPVAACIAEHESGGRQYATGTAGERGYWQIHPDHGALSTYNAYGNARAAIIISSNGRNWFPWTTHSMCGV